MGQSCSSECGGGKSIKEGGVEVTSEAIRLPNDQGIREDDDPLSLASQSFHEKSKLEPCSDLNPIPKDMKVVISKLGPVERHPKYDKILNLTPSTSPSKDKNSAKSTSSKQTGPVRNKNTGNTYKGGFLRGKPHGFGQFVPLHGAYIEGYFDNGMPAYYFMIVNPDLTGYVGEWKDSKRHGRGKSINMNGEIAEGDWVEDKMHGDFKIWDCTGELIFAGKMARNRKEGCCYFYDSKHNTKYTGDFRDGLYYGEGVMFYDDGSKFSGFFEGGRRQGPGVLSNPDDKTEYKGLWVNDKKKGTFLVTVDGKTKVEVYDD